MQSIASIPPDTRRSEPFTTPISRSDLQILVHETEVAARLVRLKSFDPPRGSLAHPAAPLTARVRRNRSMFAPISLADPMPDAKSTTVGDAIAESSGYAMMGQPTDGFANADRGLDLDRARGTLRRSDLALCAHLRHLDADLAREPPVLAELGRRVLAHASHA